MDQITADMLQQADLDMSTLEGRIRFAVMLLGIIDYAGKKKIPIKPMLLDGYESIDLKRIMEKPRPDRDDMRMIKVHAEWRKQVLAAEGINEVNLRSGLRAIQIFDEALASEDMKESEKEGIPTKRETMVYLLRNVFDVESEDLDGALAKPWEYSRQKCRDMAAFNHYWRDPLRGN